MNKEGLRELIAETRDPLTKYTLRESLHAQVRGRELAVRLLDAIAERILDRLATEGVPHAR